MYYVNKEQIDNRLAFLPYLQNSCREIGQRWSATDCLVPLAQERALHLALETVTDIGSLLIDGFLMRDASSYEDIIEVIRGEDAIDEATSETLYELVKLRRLLVQEYTDVDRSELHPLVLRLPETLSVFSESVKRFMARELGQ